MFLGATFRAISLEIDEERNVLELIEDLNREDKSCCYQRK